MHGCITRSQHAIKLPHPVYQLLSAEHQPSRRSSILRLPFRMIRSAMTELTIISRWPYFAIKGQGKMIMSTVSPDGLTALCLSVGIARTGVIYVLNFVRHFMMPIHVGTGCLPATISDSRINHNARSDISPEMSAWEKIKAFFCPTHQCETLECFRNICHPPAGTTREDVLNRF